MPANTAGVSVDMILHSHAAPPGSPREEVKMGEEAATPARGAAEGGKDGRKVAVQYGDDLDFLKELMDEDVVKESDVKDIVSHTTAAFSDQSALMASRPLVTMTNSACASGLPWAQFEPCLSFLPIFYPSFPIFRPFSASGRQESREHGQKSRGKREKIGRNRGK